MYGFTESNESILSLRIFLFDKHFVTKFLVTISAVFCFLVHYFYDGVFARIVNRILINIVS